MKTVDYTEIISNSEPGTSAKEPAAMPYVAASPRMPMSHDYTQSLHYQSAMADVSAGRVTEWESVDEMFEKLEL